MTWVASDLVRSRGSKMVIDRRRKWAGAALVLIVAGVILAGCEGRRKEPVGTEDMTDVAKGQGTAGDAGAETPQEDAQGEPA